MRLLTCDGVIQTAVPTAAMDLRPGTLIRARDYVELAAYYRPAARTALIIGLGGGLHARAFACHRLSVHAVDIEPAIIPLAREYFGFTGEATVSDGRAFLDRTDRQFDVMVLDTFQGSSVPPHLYTKEAFTRMRECLTAEGVLAVHLVARPQHPATAAVARTLTAVFPHSVAVQSGFGNGLQHIYLIASSAPLELSPEQRLQLDAYGFVGDEFFVPKLTDGPLLTDEQNRLGQLCRDLAAEHRRRSFKMIRRPSW
jgi:spermidine synthase